MSQTRATLAQPVPNFECVLDQGGGERWLGACPAERGQQQLGQWEEPTSLPFMWPVPCTLSPHAPPTPATSGSSGVSLTT